MWFYRDLSVVKALVLHCGQDLFTGPHIDFNWWILSGNLQMMESCVAAGNEQRQRNLSPYELPWTVWRIHFQVVFHCVILLQMALKQSSIVVLQHLWNSGTRILSGMELGPVVTWNQDSGDKSMQYCQFQVYSLSENVILNFEINQSVLWKVFSYIGNWQFTMWTTNWKPTVK